MLTQSNSWVWLPAFPDFPPFTVANLFYNCSRLHWVYCCKHWKLPLTLDIYSHKTIVRFWPLKKKSIDCLWGCRSWTSKRYDCVITWSWNSQAACTKFDRSCASQGNLRLRAAGDRYSIRLLGQVLCQEEALRAANTIISVQLLNLTKWIRIIS